ncbi:MAG TPA: hypothetical protein PLI31_09560 [Methanoregulaceae archaeon]|nr:hypothetical protein [Methanoregulaceae archaeon]
MGGDRRSPLRDDRPGGEPGDRVVAVSGRSVGRNGNGHRSICAMIGVNAPGCPPGETHRLLDHPGDTVPARAEARNLS